MSAIPKMKNPSVDPAIEVLVEDFLAHEAVNAEAGRVEVFPADRRFAEYESYAALFIGAQLVAITDIYEAERNARILCVGTAICDRSGDGPASADWFEYLRARAPGACEIRDLGEVVFQLDVARDWRFPRDSLLDEIEDEYSVSERLGLIHDQLDRLLEEAEFARTASVDEYFGARSALQALREAFATPI